MIDAAATVPVKTLVKFKDEGYDHGYGKHEMSVMTTTSSVSVVAGMGTSANSTGVTCAAADGGSSFCFGIAVSSVVVALTAAKETSHCHMACEGCWALSLSTTVNVRYYCSDVSLLSGMSVGTGRVHPSGDKRCTVDLTVVSAAVAPTPKTVPDSTCIGSDESSECLSLEDAEEETSCAAVVNFEAWELYNSCMCCTGVLTVAEAYACADGVTSARCLYESIEDTECCSCVWPGEGMTTVTYAELSKVVRCVERR